MYSGTPAIRRVLPVGGRVIAALLMAAGLAAQAPAASLIVVVARDEKGGPELTIVDPAAGTVVGRVPTGPDPHIVAVSDDGRRAFVANTNAHGFTVPGGDSISVIDVPARKEIRRIPLPSGTRVHDVLAVGDKVYFTAASWKALGVYDLTRNEFAYFGLGQNGPSTFVISKDRNTIFATNQHGDSVSVLENVAAGPVNSYPAKPSDWKVTHIPVGRAPSGIALSPDGKEIWTANEESGGVSIIDVASKVSQNVDLKTEHLIRIKFTPDGKRVLLIDRPVGEVVAVDAASRKIIKRFKLPGDAPGDSGRAGDLLVSPDGSRAYVGVNARAGGGSLAVLDLKTLTFTGRIQTSVACRTGGLCANGLAWATAK